MRFLGLPLVSLLASSVVAHDDLDFLDCSNDDADIEKCAQKIDSVVAVSPGISYFAKIACKDCPYAETSNEDNHSAGTISHGDQELVSTFPG